MGKRFWAYCAQLTKTRNFERILITCLIKKNVIFAEWGKILCRIVMWRLLVITISPWLIPYAIIWWAVGSALNSIITRMTRKWNFYLKHYMFNFDFSVFTTCLWNSTWAGHCRILCLTWACKRLLTRLCTRHIFCVLQKFIEMENNVNNKIYQIIFS